MKRRRWVWSFGRNLVIVLAVIATLTAIQIAYAAFVTSNLGLGFSTTGRLSVGFDDDSRLLVGFGTTDAPTNVSATDGTHTDKVVVSWTKSTGAVGYRVYRDSMDVSGLLGDVAAYDDTGATAGTITAGTASASDGVYETYVRLLISGESANSGTPHSYTVRAVLGSGEESVDSNVDLGYRGVGALTYQWQRSAADSDASYSNISGATGEPYNDVGGATDPDGRYYRCVLSATGASSATTDSNRGYMAAATSPGGTSTTAGKAMLNSMLPIAVVGGILVGTIRIAISKRRGDILQKLPQGIMYGAIFFILAWALLEVLF